MSDELPMQCRKVVVGGVGLIGGSFIRALKASEQGAAMHFVAMGRSRASLEQALAAGVVDAIGDDWASALDGADFVLLGAPVGAATAMLTAMQPHLQAQTVISDVGSTKGDVVAAARAALGVGAAQFVPAHPIAGAEQSGVAAARADLFVDRRVVLTPLPENQPPAVALVTALWRLCGARVCEMNHAAHDNLFAAVSHLPHLLAFTLVNEFAGRNNADELFSFAAGGFRDFTRIASSHPEMWRDICVANRRALIRELDVYMEELLRARVMLAAADGDALERMFDNARSRRNAWLQGATEAAPQ